LRSSHSRRKEQEATCTPHPNDHEENPQLLHSLAKHRGEKTTWLMVAAKEQHYSTLKQLTNYEVWKKTVTAASQEYLSTHDET